MAILSRRYLAAALSVASCMVASSTAPNAVQAAAKVRNPKDPVVVLDTTKGKITMEIFKFDAPKTAGNFLDLVQKGFYNGLTFHRVEPGFVIQGGDPLGNGTGGYNDPKTGRERTIPLEVSSKCRHDSAGTVAMARSASPDSASSQFYITMSAQPSLDPGGMPGSAGYAVFGHVLSGMDVVNHIQIGDKMKKVYVQ